MTQSSPLMRSSLTAIRTHIPRIVLLIIVLFCPSEMSLAARERPWAPVTPPARLSVIAHLPAGSDWHDLVALKGGDFVLQCAPEKDVTALISVDRTGASHPFPLTAAVKNILNAPSALTRGDGDAVWIVNSRPGQTPILLKLDAQTGQLLQRVDLPPEVYDRFSHFVAIAVRAPMIYLADEGSAALVTYDLKSKISRRFFAKYPVMLGQHPMDIDGQEVRARDGRPLQRNISHLALQKDGAWLYLQTPTGPLYRLKTELLRDDRFTPVELMESMTEWRRTPTIGGISIGSDNTLYLIDRSHGRLLSFDAGRNPFVQLVDRRLVRAQTPSVNPVSHDVFVAAGSELLRISMDREQQK